MENTPRLIQLRKKAEEIFATHPRPKQTLTYNEISKLMTELEINKIELDLQTENLEMALLEIDKLKLRYVDLYDFIPISYYTLNEQGVIVESNETGGHLFGLNKNCILNQNLNRYIAPMSQSVFSEHCQKTLESNALQTCEVMLLRKDHPIFYGQLTSKLTVNTLTEERYLLTFIIDITESKQKQDYLHHYQNKLAYHDRNISIEKLTSVLAHELNHPLAVIENYLHGCIARLDSNNYSASEVSHALKQAAKQTHRAAEVILRMKNFNCNGTLHFELTNINELIKESICLINYERWNFPLDICFKQNKAIPEIFVDKIHVEQVIINLARNSIEAMRDIQVEDPRLRIEVNYLNKSSIEICMIDNGPGIPSHVVHKLFNPYFTTKPYGIGIGLAVCRSIIEAHGGELCVESSHIYGACFKFSLPINSEMSNVDSSARKKKLVFHETAR